MTTEDEINEDDLARVILGVMIIHVLKQLHGAEWKDALRQVAHGTSPPYLVVDEEMTALYDELDEKLREDQLASEWDVDEHEG